MSCDFPLIQLKEIMVQIERPETPIPGKIYRQLGVKLWGEGAYERESVDGIQTKYKTLSRVQEKDIVVNKIWARNGTVAVVPESLSGCFVSGEFPTFNPIQDRLEPRWFHWLTKTKEFWRQCGEKSQGTSGKNRIRPERFLEIETPLPTLDEQRRIVARIEELAARIEEARELRRRAVEEAESALPSTRNKIFGKLSNEFDSVRLDLVSDTRLGKMLSQKSKTGTGSTPYLRNANIQWDYLDLSDVYEMDFTEEECKKLTLQSGDILVCEGGDIGKAAIWNNEIAGCCYQKALHRVRVDQTKFVPRFLLYHLFWAAEQGHFADLKTQTTIAHLTGIKLKSYGVFVPSIQEQQSIAAYLDRLKSRLDALKRHHAETAAELDALLPAVLERAFRGEL